MRFKHSTHVQPDGIAHVCMPCSSFHPARARYFIAFVAIVCALTCAPRTHAADITYEVRVPREAVTIDRVSDFARVALDARVSPDAKGFQTLSEPGQPVLPVRVVNVLLPQGEKVDGWTFVPGAAVAVGSFENPLLGSPFVTQDGVMGRGKPLFDAANPAQASGMYPPVEGIYLGTGFWHGHAIASFAVFPLRVEKGTLYLTDSVTLHVTTTTDAAQPDIAVRQRLDRDFDEKMQRMISDFVVNPPSTSGRSVDQVEPAEPKGGFQPTSYPSLEGSPVEYVIVTSEALATEYQRLADWKTARGVPTVVRTTEWIRAHAKNGVDLAETVRFFLQDAYEKWGAEFVLLGGDTDVIPARYGVSGYLGENTEIATDLYFACLDGSWNEDHDAYWGELGVTLDNPDLYAEVYVGRISASTVSDAATVIDKVIAYETPAEPADMNKVMLAAEVLSPPDWHDGVPISFDGASLTESLWQLAFDGKPLQTTRSYETYMYYPSSVRLSRQAVIDTIEAGVNIINHIGHGSRFNFSCGDASVVQSDANALMNGDRLFFLYWVDCKVSEFDYECIAETLLKNPNGGAVGTIGASHYEFPAADSHYMNEFYDLLMNENVVRLGETMALSRLPRTPWAELGDNVDLWTHYVNTALADPEMPLFTGAVQTVNVAHVASVGLGTTSILVNVTSGGEPVDSAYVCLSKGGDDYQRGATNALGNAVFSFRAESAGQITVVVTGHNIVRHQSTITVTPGSGAYVSYASMTVDDNTSGGSFGNADGVVDAGETVDMTLSVVNTGVATSGNVTLVLRCSDPWVSVTDSTATVGTIGVGVTKAASDPFRVVLASGIVDERAVEFRLVVKEGGTAKWNDRFKKEVHAPELALTTLRIYDGSPLGNGNGVNEAGEQFRLYYGLKNYGTGLASGLTTTLKDLDGQFVFYDSTDTYLSMGSFVERENVDGFHIKEMSVSGENRLEITVTDLFSRVYRDTIELRVPLPPTALVFDASLGVDRIKITWTKSASADAARYRVFRSLVSGGPYEVASVDPVEHVLFTDLGLEPSTRYYYVVRTVDGSGNQSVYSTQGTASTNPPQLAGWPIEVMSPTSSSPVVGDMDADGDLEVVTGSTYVYAWHHDGTEFVDGDGNPQTWGVLNTQGSTFTAAVGLASLDNVPGLDIMAADLNTKKVYCFNYTGALLPGWPQVGEKDFRAAPVAGDLDGDGFCEVIAVDTRGAIYAWRGNGTEYRDGDNNPATYGIFYRTPVASYHFQTPSACDLDGDHRDEIVLATRSDSIYVINGDGSRMPGWPFKMDGEAAGSPAVGDVDGDGMLEIVAQSKGSYGRIYVLNHDGTVAAGWPRTIRLVDIYFTSSPALADFNNDGKLEIVAYGWNSTESRIYVYSYNGANYAGWPIVVSNSYSECSVTIADLDGDGDLDIVFGDESRLIHAFDISGQEIDGFPVTTGEAVRATPFICDLDHDGHTNLVVSSWDGNVYVWDLNGAYNGDRVPWPTFQANAHRNGQIGFTIPTPTAIGGGGTDDPLPTRPMLVQNYPNPFNPTTTVVFDVPEGTPQKVTLTIYDVTGALVRTLVDEVLPPGRHTREWDARDNGGSQVGTGVYFYRLKENGFLTTKKMVLLQ